MNGLKIKMNIDLIKIIYIFEIDINSNICENINKKNY